jgi:hypothetical protein
VNLLSINWADTIDCGTLYVKYLSSFSPQKKTSIGMPLPFLSSLLTPWKRVLEKLIVAKLLLERLIYSSLPQILFISAYSVKEMVVP